MRKSICPKKTEQTELLKELRKMSREKRSDLLHRIIAVFRRAEFKAVKKKNRPGDKPTDPTVHEPPKLRGIAGGRR